jgi:hypothetical protein
VSHTIDHEGQPEKGEDSSTTYSSLPGNHDGAALSASRENAGASDPCAVKADVPRPTANRRPRTDLTRRQRPASRPMLVPSKYQPPLSPPFQQAQGSNNDGWTLVAGEWRNRRQGTRCSPSGNGRSTSSSASMCCLQVFFFAYFYSYAYYLVCLDKTVLQVSSAGIPASDK